MTKQIGQMSLCEILYGSLRFTTISTEAANSTTNDVNNFIATVK